MEALILERLTTPKMQTGWRNKYWLRFAIVETQTGKIHDAGENWAPQVWASRDLAETYAMKTLAVWAEHGRASDIEHLGAFPCDACADYLEQA